MDKPIRINVAGKIFTTSMHTLGRYPESTLYISIASTLGLQEFQDEGNSKIEDPMQTSTDDTNNGVSTQCGIGNGADAVYFLDRDADAFADILRYMRHPEAYKPPADPAFRYLVWCEARFYCLNAISQRLGEVEMRPEVEEYTNPEFRITPGLLSVLSGIPGGLHTCITRERSTDPPYHVHWTEGGIGYPKLDSITDSRSLDFSFPYHQIRLSGIAMHLDRVEFGLAIQRVDEWFDRPWGGGDDLEIQVSGVTADNTRHPIMTCKPLGPEPVRRCAVHTPHEFCGLTITCHLEESRDLYAMEVPFTIAVLVLQQLELYGRVTPVLPRNCAADVRTYAKQMGQEPGSQWHSDDLGVGRWTRKDNSS